MTYAAGLDPLGIPPATARILGFFARNPTSRPTVRELQRTLGVASASAQRDLDRLTRAQALRVVVDGRMRRYAPVLDSPIWAAVRILISGNRPLLARREVHERSQRYGVDLGQLESALRLSVEERIIQLDANASFLAAARAGRAK